MKERHQSPKLFIFLGLLLLAASAYTLYWVQSRGGLGNTPVEVPIQLEEGKSSVTRFIVREKGEHVVEIQFAKNASSRFALDHLNEISGKALLTCDNQKVEAVLPVYHEAWTRDSASIVLFSTRMVPRKQYVLSLHVEQIPPALARSHASVRVAVDVRNYHLIFWRDELLALLLFVLALLCGFPPIRRQAWHLRRPFLIMVIASGAIIVAGFMLPHRGFFTDWNRWLMNISGIFLGIGPIVLVLSVTFWFVASCIAYVRSRCAKSPP
jgi:hypothetical protein